MSETTKTKAPRVRKPRAKTGVKAVAAAPASEVFETPAPSVTETLPDLSPAQFAEMIEAVTSPAIESDIIPGPAIAAPTSEGLVDMATIASPAEATEKAQAMFGEISGRVKTAFEKSTKLGEDMVDFSKGNVEAVIASAKVAAKAAELMGQEAADYGKKNFETATAAFKSFAAVKSPAELFQLQSEYAKASFDSAVAEASKFSESMMKLAGDIAQPLSNRYALAAEKIKAATTL
ncbi:phasin family protein [Sphingomonas sp. MMS24-J13]|uniref:phasin family protein n=1 Tax=Sphingomonas sp. MMS24-J13 TaxID=3238686 RepID=UPI00384B8B05